MPDDSLPELKRPFPDGLLCIHVSNDATSFPLNHFADFLCQRTGGRILQKLGAPWIDEAYWDIQVGPHVLVLHYQHYLGIFVCAGNPAAEFEVERLLPSVREYVTPGVRSLPNRPHNNE